MRRQEIAAKVRQARRPLRAVLAPWPPNSTFNNIRLTILRRVTLTHPCRMTARTAHQRRLLAILTETTRPATRTRKRRGIMALSLRSPPSSSHPSHRLGCWTLHLPRQGAEAMGSSATGRMRTFSQPPALHQTPGARPRRYTTRPYQDLPLSPSSSPFGGLMIEVLRIHVHL